MSELERGIIQGACIAMTIVDKTLIGVQPSIVQDVCKAMGITVNKARICGVDPYDIKTLKKAGVK